MNEYKFKIQNDLYNFPYHYLAYIEKDEVPIISRNLSWGFEYLTYISAVFEEINNIQFESILDIGCGDGYLLNNLNNKAKKFGIDLSESAIRFANSFSSDAIFKKIDVFKLTGSYDLVTMIEVLEHIPDDLIPDFMSKVISLIKPKGFFIVSVPSINKPLLNKHYRHYDCKLLSEHIEKYGSLKIIKERFVYNYTFKLKIITKIFNNRLWTINSKILLKMFWKWHKKSNFETNMEKGQHIIRVYKKL